MFRNKSITKKGLKVYNNGFSIKMLVVTFSSLMLFTTGYAQKLNAEKLNQFFDRLDEKHKAMGTIYIAQESKMLYARSIGYSNISETDKKPSSESTKYRVGSVTKMFTASMILQLVEKGKLKLTDNLDKFFPEMKNADKITIAQILAHRSGIHDVTNDSGFRTLRLSGATKDEIRTFIAKANTDFEPGVKYAYSNTGYFILGMLIEKLTNKTYQQNLEERITNKIALQDTYLGTGNIDTIKNESFSYKYQSQWIQQPETHISLLFGSGALISTPSDMAKFIHALFNGKIVSKNILQQMMNDSLGMTSFTYHGKTFYGHTGGVDNFGSWLVYQPEEKLVVSYATNAKVFPVTNIIDGVFNIYYNKPFVIPAFETIALSPEVLDQYVGVYALPQPPVKFTISRNGATLSAQMNEQAPIPLETMGPAKFGVESAGIVFEFDVEKNTMTQKRGGRERVFTKEK